MRVLAAIVLALCAACEDDRAQTEVRFAEVEAASVPDPLRVDGSPAETRLLLLDALDDRPGAPPLAGAGDWRTRVWVRGDEDATRAAERGRTYVVRGEGELQLDVRLGAGDRGGYMGEVVGTGAERAMIQIEVSDPATVGARFDIAIVADDGPGEAHPRDVTPRHLTRRVPGGTYRAWVDVPPRGGRYLASVAVHERGGEAVAWAWSSPIAVERPWL